MKREYGGKEIQDSIFNLLQSNNMSSIEICDHLGITIRDAAIAIRILEEQGRIEVVRNMLKTPKNINVS
ncbi:hypothetical protein [Citrobacter koseri]|uniref:hypothetical protein n=1 Tax=Citrobacter koseri TaxID=545 RepID=UPI001907DA8F|nr:hypothetical protein [Citrobacter koseri]MBJ9142243.1 hypothetical protein [Citrobacter koseri]